MQKYKINPKIYIVYSVVSGENLFIRYAEFIAFNNSLSYNT